ncbi:prevent-host-death protein [Longispora sp. NPDC051575]|uniref:prevent-host-death protein n=1 Tax=Longispora sp. NPDC051575 TaxID=3154943 RepID=UPI0034259156
MSEVARELTVTDAREQLARVVNEAAYAGAITYLTRHGQRIAAIVPVNVAVAAEELEDNHLAALAHDALTRIESGEPTVEWSALRAELDEPEEI